MYVMNFGISPDIVPRYLRAQLTYLFLFVGFSHFHERINSHWYWGGLHLGILIGLWRLQFRKNAVGYYGTPLNVFCCAPSGSLQLALPDIPVNKYLLPECHLLSLRVYLL